MTSILIRVGVFVVIVFAVSLAVISSAACHRWYGPLLLGNDDPVAVAVFCRGNR